MPIEIIQKQKTKPQVLRMHKPMVPLRVAETDCTKDMGVFNGEIVMVLPSKWHTVGAIFNCTTGFAIETKFADSISCVRAYDVAQVVLVNDDEPAPIT